MTDEIATHPEFAANGSFGHLRLGRTKPDAAPKLKLASYLDIESLLPARPQHIDYFSAVPDWPMYGNDILGDCTWAAVGHMVQAWTTALGGGETPTLADIERGYWETGQPPAATGQAGGPTDDGRVETDVLGYWRTQGIPNEGHKIVAYAEVERHHVREAAWLFGGVYIGAELPLTAQTQTVWDYVADAPDGENEPGSWGGHAIPIVGFNRHGFTVITWGAPLFMTDAFRLAYVDQVYAIITEEWIAQNGETLAGFNMAQLQADLAQVTGQSAEAAGAVLPAAPAPATPEPQAEPEPASAPETAEEPPSQPQWTASAPPLVVNGQDTDRARTIYLHTLAQDPSQISVVPVNEATAPAE